MPAKGAPGRGQGNETDTKVRISFFAETEYAKRDSRKQTERCNKLKGTPRRSWETEKHLKNKKNTGLNVKAKHRGVHEAPRGEA